MYDEPVTLRDVYDAKYVLAYSKNRYTAVWNSGTSELQAELDELIAQCDRADQATTLVRLFDSGIWDCDELLMLVEGIHTARVAA